MRGAHQPFLGFQPVCGAWNDQYNTRPRPTAKDVALRCPNASPRPKFAMPQNCLNPGFDTSVSPRSHR